MKYISDRIQDDLDLVTVEWVKNNVKSSSKSFVFKDITDLETEGTVTAAPSTIVIANGELAKCYLKLQKQTTVDSEITYGLRFTASTSWDDTLSITSEDSSVTVFYSPDFPSIQAGLTYDIYCTYFDKTHIVIYGKELDFTKTVVLNENSES